MRTYETRETYQKRLLKLCSTEQNKTVIENNRSILILEALTTNGQNENKRTKREHKARQRKNNENFKKGPWVRLVM